MLSLLAKLFFSLVFWYLRLSHSVTCQSKSSTFPVQFQQIDPYCPCLRHSYLFLPIHPSACLNPLVTCSFSPFAISQVPPLEKSRLQTCEGVLHLLIGQVLPNPSNLVFSRRLLAQRSLRRPQFSRNPYESKVRPAHAERIPSPSSESGHTPRQPLAQIDPHPFVDQRTNSPDFLRAHRAYTYLTTPTLRTLLYTLRFNRVPSCPFRPLRIAGAIPDHIRLPKPNF